MHKYMIAIPTYTDETHDTKQLAQEGCERKTGCDYLEKGSP